MTRFFVALFLLVLTACAHGTRVPSEPVTFEEHLRLAAVYTVGNEDKLALREYARAIELRDDNAVVYSAMGALYLKVGGFSEAEAAFLRAVTLEPDNGIFHNNLGWAQMEQGRLVVAVASVDRALVLDPRRSHIYLDTLGVIFTRLGDYKHAEITLKEAALRTPLYETKGLVHILNHLLGVYLASGEEVKREQVIQRIKEAEERGGG